MSSGLKVAGVDLDSIFAPWHSGWAQAGTTGYHSAGVDLNQRYAPIATGSAASATGFKSSSNDINIAFAAYGSTGVQVATQPGNISGSSAAGLPSGTVTTGSTTCAGTKGGGTYTYTWHIASGSGVSFTAPNSATTAITGTVPASQTISGTMYCTISDGITSVNTATRTWSIQNTTPAFGGALHVYVSGSGTETVPTGATNVIIELWGGGASGGGAEINSGITHEGGGGGGGAYASVTYTVSGGQTIAYSVGAGGAAVTGGTGTSGNTSTASSGSLPITTMTAGGGSGGTSGTAAGPGGGGSGGAASGGSTNTSGNVGGRPLGAAGISGTVSGDGSPYGAGGTGSANQGSPSGSGSHGAVVFYYPA